MSEFEKKRNIIDKIFSLFLLAFLFFSVFFYYKEKKKNDLYLACHFYLSQLNNIRLSEMPYFVELDNCESKKISVYVHFTNYKSENKLDEEAIYNKIIYQVGKTKLSKIIIFNTHLNQDGSGRDSKSIASKFVGE